jgi:hypothetical protein
MARNTKNDDSINDINSIKFGIKDIITIITCVVSIMIGYFGIVKDIETRLVRIETRFEELDKKIYAINEGLQLNAETPSDKLILHPKPPQNLLSKKEEKLKIRNKKTERNHSEEIMSDSPSSKEE